MCDDEVEFVKMGPINNNIAVIIIYFFRCSPLILNERIVDIVFLFLLLEEHFWKPNEHSLQFAICLTVLTFQSIYFCPVRLTNLFKKKIMKYPT